MTPQDFAAQFDVSRETLARLTIYREILEKWQQSVNLVGASTLTQFWSRHAADSAQVLRFVPDSAKVWLDLGSGAGFPGLVLGILLGENAHVHMVESDRKKVNFLRAVIRETGAPAQVHHMRIEALSDNLPPELAQIDVITARAVARLSDLARLMAPFFNSSTIALLHKGREWQEELTQCQQYWTLDYIAHESCTDMAARLLELRDLRAR